MRKGCEERAAFNTSFFYYFISKYILKKAAICTVFWMNANAKRDKEKKFVIGRTNIYNSRADAQEKKFLTGIHAG